MGRTQGVSFSETPCSASKRHIRFYSVPVGLTTLRSISFRIELTVNVNTLFHDDGKASKAGDLRLSRSKNFFLAREQKSCREKYLERCWLKRAGALTLTVNSMRM